MNPGEPSPSNLPFPSPLELHGLPTADRLAGGRPRSEGVPHFSSNSETSERNFKVKLLSETSAGVIPWPVVKVRFLQAI